MEFSATPEQLVKICHQLSGKYERCSLRARPLMTIVRRKRRRPGSALTEAVGQHPPEYWGGLALSPDVCFYPQVPSVLLAVPLSWGFVFGVPFVSSHSSRPVRRYSLKLFCHLSRVPSHRKVDDLPDHLGIGEAGFLRCHGKFLSAGEPWVRIRFDDINLALAR
jgi:hypothetical protein